MNIEDAKNDGAIFARTHHSEKRRFIENLLNDPRTVAYSPEIVAWLFQASSPMLDVAVKEKDAEIIRLREELALSRKAPARNTSVIIMALTIARQQEALRKADVIMDSYSLTTEEVDADQDFADWAVEFADVLGVPNG